MSLEHYLDVVRAIPRGETRTFLDVARLAGRPGGARTASRAVHACPVDSPVPWHRVVASNGALAKDPSRAALQLARLREEGARPLEGEPVRAWCERARVPFVGRLPERIFAPAGDPRADRWPAARVEPLAGALGARSRGFVPLPSGSAGSSRSARAGERRADRGSPARDGPLPAPPAERRAGPNAPLAARLAAIDLAAARRDLAASGFLRVPRLLAPAECDAIRAAAHEPDRFERTIEMRPKGYGIGTYQYWREPLPDPLDELRERLYALLVPLAREFGSDELPATLGAFHARCRAAGQRRASSILIDYGSGGVNWPHRDIYGKVWFPLQGLVVLSRRGVEFDGGDFVLYEDERRAVAADEGDLVLFRSQLRHGMDPITRGERHAVGLVFHLAQ